MSAIVELKTWDIEGAVFLVPDVDPTDTEGRDPDHFTIRDVGAFYDAFFARFGYPYLDVAYKVLLTTKHKRVPKLRVVRVDKYTYRFTIFIGRFKRDGEVAR